MRPTARNAASRLAALSAVLSCREERVRVTVVVTAPEGVLCRSMRRPREVGVWLDAE